MGLGGVGVGVGSWLSFFLGESLSYFCTNLVLDLVHMGVLPLAQYCFPLVLSCWCTPSPCFPQ